MQLRHTEILIILGALDTRHQSTEQLQRIVHLAKQLPATYAPGKALRQLVEMMADAADGLLDEAHLIAFVTSPDAQPAVCEALLRQHAAAGQLPSALAAIAAALRQNLEQRVCGCLLDIQVRLLALPQLPGANTFTHLTLSGKIR